MGVSLTSSCAMNPADANMAASVLEFLRGHFRELFEGFGLESQRIEANVTGVVIGVQFFGETSGISRLDPAGEGTIGLCGSDGNGKDLEEDGRRRSDLVEVTDSGTNVLSGGVEERVEAGFLDQETDDGKHGNTSVGGLGFTVSLHGVEVAVLGESEGVEFSDRGEGSGKAVGEFRRIRDPSVAASDGSRVEGGRRALGGLGGEGRNGRKEEGSCEEEFHFGDFLLLLPM